MRKSKVRMLLMASVLIMLCAAMIVGGTYALWSGSVKVETHLSAGELKIGLERTRLIKKELNEQGYLTTTDEEATVDLTDPTTANVFGLEGTEKLVPGASYAARLELTNTGDVAFTYEIIVKLTEGDSELSEQLHVYVDTGSGYEDKGLLSEYAAPAGQAVIATQSMSKTDSAKVFWVKIEFDDLDAETNNTAQNQSVAFDLLVKAVQATEA